MEMTELDNAFLEIKIDNIRSIDHEISELETQISRLKARKNGLMIGDLDLVGKYYRVTNFGSSYVSYVHPERISANKTGVTVEGETYITLDLDGQVSIEYLEGGNHQYDLDPNIHSNIFEEITKEEFVFEVQEVLNKLNKEVTKSRK